MAASKEPHAFPKDNSPSLKQSWEESCLVSLIQVCEGQCNFPTYLSTAWTPLIGKPKLKAHELNSRGPSKYCIVVELSTHQALLAWPVIVQHLL